MGRLFYLISAALLCAALGLTGCGRKGPLEAPPGARPASGGATGDSAKPQRPFILDPLVR